jgi:NDP-mannose synthase
MTSGYQCDQVVPRITEGMRAVILAGGKGTRLRPFTVNFPKPLVPVGDQPVLELVMRYLLRHGIRDITLTLGHLRELIKAYFAHAERFSEMFDLSYVEEEQPTGTAGSLVSVPDLNDTFLVMNGDVMTDLDLGQLVSFHREKKAALTIATEVRHVKIDLGVLDFDEDSRIIGYREKPEHSYHVSMGIYVYEPRVLKYIKPDEYLDFPNLVLRLMEYGEPVSAFVTDCMWLDIGRPDDYAKAQRLFGKAENEDVEVA